MQNLEWYLADLKSTEKNTIETVEKSLTDMFIRLVRIYPCLIYVYSDKDCHCVILPRIALQKKIQRQSPHSYPLFK